MVEGINNRIKMMKRRAFGYRNFQAFRTRVLVEFL
ncbi:MAG: transposase [Bacteroidota bacterium]